MSNIPLPNYCVEYMVTGVHAQIKYADCIVCSKEKYFKDLEIEEAKAKDDKNAINEEDYDDEFENLVDIVKDIGYEDEEDVQGDQNKNQGEDFTTKLDKIQQDFIQIIVKIMNKNSGIEFVLDNTMGQIINPNKMNECRFNLASRCLSQSLESIGDKLYNVFSTNGDVLSTGGLAKTSSISIQKADDFLISLDLHGKKETLVDTLVQRVKESSEATQTIVVLTDFVSSDYETYRKQVEEVFKQRKNPVTIHIISFNIAGVDTNEEKSNSFKFFQSIADLSKGTFTGILSLDENVKEPQL